MDDRRLMYFKDPLVRPSPRVLLFWLVTQFVPRTSSLSLFVFPRMPMPVARCSSAVRRTATPSCPACPRPRRAATGTTASPSSRRTGSSCSPARPRPSNGIGYRPSRGSSIGQWGRRNMQVRKISYEYWKGLFDVRELFFFSVLLLVFMSLCLKVPCGVFNRYYNHYIHNIFKSGSPLGL